jgi:DNA-binding MarR family transcriptional regulator
MKKIDPDNSIGFLIHDVGRLMRRNFDQRVQPLGLTQAQWRALVHISRHEGCRQATLSEILDIKPITLTRLLDRMQDAGWVERRPDMNDRRAVNIYITPKARPLMEKFKEFSIQTRQQSLEGISEDEYQVLLSTLKKIKRNLSS